MIPSFRLLLVALVLAAPALAQVPKPPDASRARYEVGKMRTGSQRVRDDDKAQAAKNLANIKTVADWLAYSIAQPPYNGEPVPRDAKGPNLPADQSTMSFLMSEAENFCTLPIGPGNAGKISPEQLEYAEDFGVALAEAAKVVLANAARPIERINAVRMMAVATKMPCAKLADPLADVALNAKVNDAEKLYAFQGLEKLLAQPDIIDPTRNLVRDPATQAKVANALTAYISLARDDRERAVVEFVRRHAVAALAQFKVGVIRQPNGQLLARPSWTLVRIIEQDPSVSPPFTIQEQIEAGIGLGQMKIDPDMNLDVAAYTMAKLLFQFAAAKNLDSERAGAEERKPILPWKLSAARLSYALSAWREALKPIPKTRFPDAASSIAALGISMMAIVERDGVTANTSSDATAVTAWAQSNPPKAWSAQPPTLAQMYKDDPKSVLPFASPAPPKKAESKLATPDGKAADPKAPVKK